MNETFLEKWNITYVNPVLTNNNVPIHIFSHNTGAQSFINF